MFLWEVVKIIKFIEKIFVSEKKYLSLQSQIKRMW